MIHARGEGETFGLSCGEFSLCNKPIITWANSNDRAHIEILGDQGFYYKNKKDLKNIFSFFETHIQEIRSSHLTAYSKYTPEVVMETFDKVFLTPHEK